MNLLNDPFHILCASVREDKRSLVVRADYRASDIGDEACNSALAMLTSPNKRLAAEVAWLPGVEPMRALKLMEIFEAKPATVLLVDNISHLARANLIASALECMHNLDVGELTTWLLELAREFAAIDTDEVLAMINAAREEAAFTPVARPLLIAELERHREYYRSVVRSSLCELAFDDTVDTVSETIESACSSTDISPIIEDILEIYEEHVRPALDREEESIFSCVKAVRSALEADSADAEVTQRVNTLERVVDNWGYIAFPIMTIFKSRGARLDQAVRISDALKELSYDMLGTYGEVGASRQIASLLLDIFDVSVDITAMQQPAESEPQKRFKRFGLRDGTFSNRGAVYSIDDITSLSINKVYNARTPSEIDQVKIQIDLTEGRQTVITAGGMKLFSYRSRDRKIEDAIAFFVYLSSITFDQRVDRYENEAREKGFFEYGGCFFCPGEKVVLKGYNFKLAETDFLLIEDGVVEMRIRRDGPGKQRYMFGKPRFSIAVDTDVITYLLKKHFGIDLS